MAFEDAEFFVQGEWVSSEMPICEQHCGKDHLNKKDQQNAVDVEEKLPLVTETYPK